MGNYDFDWSDTVWKSNRRKWIHSMHSMCSYLAMFPPTLPNYFVKQFSQEGEIIFDPFSGRGTTPLEACLNNRIGIGNDLNPLAEILTGAKTNIPNLDSIFKRIEFLKENYAFEDISETEPYIRMLYNEQVTLPQLLYLKRNLNMENKTDKFIMGVLLGIMHGKQRKDGTSMYLSISMPNTFSMSPNYIKNYIQEHNLKPPCQDAFDCLHNRMKRLFNSSLDKYRQGKSYGRDAVQISYDKDIFNERSIDLIITSPPYLKVINYGTYNWIRLWMLSKSSKNVDEKLRENKVYNLNKDLKLKDNLIFNLYLEFMKDVIIGWERILKDDGMAFVVIGDVSNYNDKYIKLGEEVWNYVRDKTSLNLVHIIEDSIENKTKVTRIWGSNKRGNATKTDRILVLAKGNIRRPNFIKDISNNFNY